MEFIDILRAYARALRKQSHTAHRIWATDWARTARSNRVWYT